MTSLRARLTRLEREAAARQRQLEHYATDLREIFKQERLRAQELRRSYKATVLALGTAAATPTACPATRSRSPRACSRSPTRSTRSRPTGPRHARGRRRVPAA